MTLEADLSPSDEDSPLEGSDGLATVDASALFGDHYQRVVLVVGQNSPTEADEQKVADNSKDNSASVFLMLKRRPKQMNSTCELF